MPDPDSPQWARLARALDPQRTLRFGEELSRLYVEPLYSPAIRVIRGIKGWQRSNQGYSESGIPPKFVFCGARGSGKTTQLRQMHTALAADDFEVLLLDLAPVLPERVGTVQLVAHMGLGLLARLAHWEAGGASLAAVLASREASEFSAALAGFVDSPGVPLDLAALVDAISPILTVAGVVPPTSASTARAVIGAATETWQMVKERLRPVKRVAQAQRLMRRLGGDELGEAQDLVRTVGALASALHAKAGRPPVLLVDGLDRILRLEDVLLTFDDIDLLRDLDLPMVLTGPAVLRQDVRFAGMRNDVSVLMNHNFPVVDADGRARPEGVRAMVQLLDRRLEGGLSELVAPEAAEKAAIFSSGIPREFLRLLFDAAQRSAERSAERVTLNDVLEIVHEMRLLFQQPLTVSDLRMLAHVARNHRLSGEAREEELLYQNLIASYPNQNGYFRPHEILVEWVQQETARLSTQGQPVDKT